MRYLIPLIQPTMTMIVFSLGTAQVSTVYTTNHHLEQHIPAGQAQNSHRLRQVNRSHVQHLEALIIEF